MVPPRLRNSRNWPPNALPLFPSISYQELNFGRLMVVNGFSSDGHITEVGDIDNEEECQKSANFHQVRKEK